MISNATEHLAGVPIPMIAGGLLLFTGILCLFRQAYSTDIPFIRGIPEPPGAVPFLGHLKTLGDDHPTKFEAWANQNDWPVIQAKFGTRRVLVLNTFPVAQHFVVKNATATIGRPEMWTFHNVLSKTQGGTIGTSPWNETTKRRRTAVSAYMTRPAIQRSGPLLDTECGALVQSLMDSSVNGGVDVNPEVHFKRMALNIATMISYGTRFNEITDPELLKMLRIVETVSTFRSTNKNMQDYVPLLRYLPANSRSALAAGTREKRDEWLNMQFDAVQSAVKTGSAKACVTEELLNNSKTNLTMDDIKSINVSLVSGGYETLATTSTATLGFLATERGQEVQQRAYEDLMQVYGNIEKAWAAVHLEEKSPYIVGLVREMLRYFAPIQLLPPRETTKEFEWNGVTIPKGITVYQNTQAINHCKVLYGDDAHVFRPERWLSDQTDGVKTAPDAPYHFSYGAGSRACPAIAISNRILYATFARIILALEIRPAASGALLDTNYITYNQDTTLQTCKPKDFAVKIACRSEESKCLVESCA